MVIIEMNPRVSRSSALASKATGFPIAKVAARLAVGYTLDEITNDITGVTPASFEPTIDYVVTKVPRFTFEKFPETEPLLTTSMKSVGEVMAIGRSFAESLQKALRSLETGLDGLDEIEIEGLADPERPQDALRAALGRPTPDRLRVIAQAFRAGLGVRRDPARLPLRSLVPGADPGLVQVEERVRADGLPDDAQGCSSSRRWASPTRGWRASRASRRPRWRRAAQALGVHPVFKRVDTCAAEFEARTPYLYSCYETGLGDGATCAECEAWPSARRKVIILGGGPNRIGQGIEFDYCCVHAAFALAEAGFETIMVNCNPETVSTDYDTSDRLYFEPLTAEDVLEIVRVEARARRAAGRDRAARRPDTAQARARRSPRPGCRSSAPRPTRSIWPRTASVSSSCSHRLGLRQPANGIGTRPRGGAAKAERIGYPVVLRPSYVLGGQAMRIVHSAGRGRAASWPQAGKLAKLGRS